MRAGHPWVFSNEILMDADDQGDPAGLARHPARAERRGAGAGDLQSAFADRGPRAVDQSRGHGRCAVPRPAARPGDGLARPAGRRSLLPADPCRGRRPARRDHRPLRRRAGRAGEHRRHGAADAGAARGARGRAVAQHDRAQERFAGARARRAGARARRWSKAMPRRPIELVENDAKFVADLSGGQKTGWFYDQRDNRRFMAGLAKDANVLDVYSYSGGFGVLAAAQRREVGRLRRPLAARARRGQGGGGAERCRQDRVVREERGLRRAGEAQRQELRRGDLRSAGLREKPQGSQDRRPGLSQAGAARGTAGDARAASSSSPPARTWSIRRCSPSRCAAACATPAAPAASCAARARRSIIRCIPACPRPPISRR